MVGQLLDRDRELEDLSGGLARAIAKKGTAALITGEAGIGKTTLLKAFLTRLNPSVSLYRGACEDLGIAEPMGPVRDLIRDAGSELSYDPAGGESLLSLFANVLETCACNPQGNVVVIEDFHWADDATVDFVRYMSRRIADEPVFLIVTSRIEKTESRQRIRRAFGDLSSDAMVRLELAALSKEAVGELCRETRLDPDDVHEASGGNAFFVNELIRSPDGALPSSIRDAVMARADRLPEEGRKTLELVSVFPRRAEVEHVLSLGPPEIEDGLESCLDSGLLGSDGANVFFTHELAREAVRSTVSPLRQRSLNAAIYARLSAGGDQSLSRVLHHAREAGDMAAVADLAPRAARAAARLGSWPEAATYFELAIETAGDTADADMLEEAAFVSYLGSGQGTAALYQERALALIDRDADPIRYGEALRKKGRYLWFRSEFSEAIAAAKEAVRVLSDHVGPELALAHSTVSQLYMARYFFHDVRAPAETAIALAEENDWPEILAHALNNYGMSHTFEDFNAARGYMQRSLDLSLDLDNPEHAARAMSNWMHLEYETCHFAEAAEMAARGAAFSRENELNGFYFYASGMVARANLRLCRWSEVEGPASRGFDPDVRLPLAFHANAGLALFHLSVRRRETAPVGTEEYLTLFDTKVAEAQRLAPFAEAMAERDWQAGHDPADAIARLYRAEASAVLPETVACVYTWLKRLGEDATPDDISLFPEPYRLELEGDHDGAAAAWAERGAYYDQALALAFGDQEQRLEAAALFDNLGIGPPPERYLTTARTVKRGRPVQRGPFGLTRRQIEVLAQLEQGKSNAQIGEALFISPKTVDHHVSAILAALGVASRGEAAAKARELGLI